MRPLVVLALLLIVCAEAVFFFLVWLTDHKRGHGCLYGVEDSWWCKDVRLSPGSAAQ